MNQTDNGMRLHLRIYEDLKGRMESGDLKAGDVLPTERELQQTFGVSRAPVRQALAKLETEGRIRRIPGRGTEVIHPRIAPFLHLSGFGHYYSQVADRVTSRTLSVQTVPADEDIASHLRLTPGALVLEVRRVRMIDGGPAAYMKNYLAPDLDAELPDSGGEIFALQDVMNRLLRRKEEVVEEDLVAIAAPDDVAELLQTQPGAPVLYAVRRGWDGSRVPVEFSRYWVRTDKMSYRTFMSKSKSKR